MFTVTNCNFEYMYFDTKDVSKLGATIECMFVYYWSCFLVSDILFKY